MPAAAAAAAPARARPAPAAAAAQPPADDSDDWGDFAAAEPVDDDFFADSSAAPHEAPADDPWNPPDAAPGKALDPALGKSEEESEDETAGAPPPLGALRIAGGEGDGDIDGNGDGNGDCNGVVEALEKTLELSSEDKVARGTCEDKDAGDSREPTAQPILSSDIADAVPNPSSTSAVTKSLSTSDEVHQESPSPSAPATVHAPSALPDAPSPLRGFDTLDDVQRYAVGALSVVLLSRYARGGDLNGAAFAASLSASLLRGLGLRPGQEEALRALDPDDDARDTVVAQCVELVGGEAHRFCVVQAMLALAVAGGVYDARSRAFLMAVARVFSVDWRALAAVELAVAIQLVEEAAAAAEAAEIAAAAEADAEVEGGDREREGEWAVQGEGEGEGKEKREDGGDPGGALERVDDVARGGVDPRKVRRTAGAALAARRKRKQKARRAMKVSGITLVGGILFGVTGGLIAPALLSALAGVGITSAAGLAGAGTVASGAAVGSLFGVAGAGISGKKAHRRTGSALDEFDFETKDDPRVVEARRAREERKAAKLAKEQVKAELAEGAQGVPLAIEAAAADAPLAIEGPAPVGDATVGGGGDGGDATLSEPIPIVDGLEDEYLEKYNGAGSGSVVEDFDEEQDEKGKKRSKKKSKSKRKLVGARGLDSVGEVPGLHVCICVPGWLQGRSYGSALDQFEAALTADIPCSQLIALRWESRRLFEMSLAFAKFWASKATVTTIQQAYPHALAAASSVAGAVAFAFALPLTVVSCLDYIDNPWSVLLSRANASGEALADVLVERGYGQRPVSLVGYSLGARVVFKCLESLASRGALGIVDNVFLLGAPVTADPERWKKIRGVVAGRVVNCYFGMDWALAFFHRGCGHGVFVAGLRRVEAEGVENFDLALLGLEGHRELKDALPRAVRAMGVGGGYIEMPPAPLVKRKRGRAKPPASEDSLVDLSPERHDEGSLPFVSSWSRSSVGAESSSSAGPPAHVDCSPPRGLLVDPVDGHAGALAVPEKEAKVRDGTVSGATDVDAMWTSELEHTSSLAAENKGDKKSDSAKKKKKKKVPAWLSSLGASWNVSGGSSGNASTKPTAAGDAQVKAEQDSAVSDWVPPPVVIDGGGNKGVAEQSKVEDEDSKVKTASGSEGDDGLDTEGEASDPASAGGGFDWELQRRIWEEQERQLRDNGIANAPVDLEVSSKVVLGIGVELTGRRLKNFVPQDTELPAPCATEVYTNCIDEQEGIVFRLYEHEKRTKYVPLNPLAEGAEKYPKFLGEVRLDWSTRAAKGKLRFSISVSVNETGDVVARAEERLREGGVGKVADLTVQRCDLCTMAERRELEAAESRRQAAAALAAAAAGENTNDALMLQAPDEPPVLALPAPGPGTEAVGSSDSEGGEKSSEGQCSNDRISPSRDHAASQDERGGR